MKDHVQNMFLVMDKYEKIQLGKVVNEFHGNAKYAVLTPDYSNQYLKIKNQNPSCEKFLRNYDKHKQQEIIDKLFNGKFDPLKDFLFVGNFRQKHSNIYGTIHGSLISGLGEYFSGIADYSLEKDFLNFAQYTVTMSMDFLLKLDMNDDIYLKFQLAKKGYKLVFISFQFFNSKYELCVQGSNIKKNIRQKSSGSELMKPKL